MSSLAWYTNWDINSIIVIYKPEGKRDNTTVTVGLNRYCIIITIIVEYPDDLVSMVCPGQDWVIIQTL